MSNPFVSILNSLLPEPQSSLLNGILFGIRATMPQSLYQALIDTGTLHIIALSGMNISILIVLMAKMTARLGKWWSGIVTIVGIALFVLFVGPAPSIVRAAIMGSFSVLAVAYGRQYWALLSLALASLLMLAVDFSLVWNLSFQLSFLATLGLILSQRKREKVQKDQPTWEEKIIYPIMQNFRLTLYAQLFTAPVILYNFQRLSLIAPVANLFIGWAIQPIMVVGFAAAMAGWIWWPLGVLPAWVAWALLTYVVTVVSWFAKAPFASVDF